MIHGNIVAACLALAVAFYAGILAKRDTKTGLGGPHGWPSVGVFILAAVLEMAALR